MREIVIKQGTITDYVRALICGKPSSGKTHFAATCPKPLFISDAAEGGYKMLYEMDPVFWWNPQHTPAVWVVDNILQDMPPLIARLEAMAHAKQFPYQTVIVDPLSIYTDRFIAEELMREPGKDNRQVYGSLANHLRALVLRFHALPAHVLWLSHLKDVEGPDSAGPAIAGQMGSKFPAYCDFKWLTTVNSIVGKPPTYELRTAPYRSWTFLGGRWKVPDPLIPSFKCVAEIMGFKEKPAHPAVPGFPDGATYADWIVKNKRAAPGAPLASVK